MINKPNPETKGNDPQCDAYKLKNMNTVDKNE